MATIEVRELTKDYGRTRAVDRLTFGVYPGRVTGFLGPNGAGKSTTMRLVLGLDRPTAGTATIDGRPLAAVERPLGEVGASLDPQAAHGVAPPVTTCWCHLRSATGFQLLESRRRWSWPGSPPPGSGGPRRSRLG